MENLTVKQLIRALEMHPPNAQVILTIPAMNLNVYCTDVCGDESIVYLSPSPAYTPDSTAIQIKFCPAKHPETQARCVLPLAHQGPHLPAFSLEEVS